MPEAAVFRAWIGFEPLSDAVRSEFVLWFFSFLVEQQEEISREHAVEIVEFDLPHFALRVSAANHAVFIDVMVEPVFDVLEVARIACTLENEVLAVEVKGLCVTPLAEVFGSRVTLHGRLNHRDRPVSFLSLRCQAELGQQQHSNHCNECLLFAKSHWVLLIEKFLRATQQQNGFTNSRIAREQ